MLSLGSVISWFNNYRERQMKKRLGYCGKDCNILPRFSCSCPEKVFLEDYTLVQPGSMFIMAGGTFTLKKWSCLSMNCTIITGNHRSTVGLCQRIVDRYHVNDIETYVVVGEDCWIGANVTILAGTKVGRGSIVGACGLLNKVTPPYAVLVGSPAKIIGAKFTLEQVLEHESKLYPPEERMSREELEEIFDKYYKGLRTFGIDSIPNDEMDIVKSHSYMQYKI